MSGETEEARCVECGHRIPHPHCWDCVLEKEAARQEAEPPPRGMVYTERGHRVGVPFAKPRPNEAGSCVVNRGSSRACERGTKGCTVRHHAPRPDEPVRQSPDEEGRIHCPACLAFGDRTCIGAVAVPRPNDPLRSAVRHYLHDLESEADTTESLEALRALAWPPGSPAEPPRQRTANPLISHENSSDERTSEPRPETSRGLCPSCLADVAAGNSHAEYCPAEPERGPVDGWARALARAAEDADWRQVDRVRYAMIASLEQRPETASAPAPDALHDFNAPRCFHVEAGKRCTRYLEGSEGERASIVEWLRALTTVPLAEGIEADVAVTGAIHALADAIERGAHASPDEKRVDGEGGHGT